MAMFHFRLKSDKKPNGTKISAVQHVEYINREGTFEHDELWNKNNKFVGNLITTGEKASALAGLETLLYKTYDFGSIKNSAKGIEVTEGASLTTISIALMLADEVLGHKPLIINGSPDFHKRLLEATMQANLSISFQDKLMQRELELRRSEKEKDSEKFFASTGKIIGERLNQGQDFSTSKKR